MALQELSLVEDQGRKKVGATVKRPENTTYLIADALEAMASYYWGGCSREAKVASGEIKHPKQVLEDLVRGARGEDIYADVY